MNKNQESKIIQGPSNKLFVPGPPKPPPTKVELPPGTTIQTLNFDEIKPNSCVVIKISPTGMQQRMAASEQIALALKPLVPIAKQKNICFILMGNNESIDILDEDQMSELGWQKKEKSLIIIPK